jgi:hypothetical protein
MERAHSRAFVYVVAAGRAMVKVGIASDVRKRLKGLQTGAPLPLELVHQVEVAGPHALPIEQQVHHKLRKHRVHGEWFRVERSRAVAALDQVANAYARDHALAGADEDGMTIAMLRCRDCAHSASVRVPAVHRLKFKCSACGSGQDRLAKLGACYSPHSTFGSLQRLFCGLIHFKFGEPPNDPPSPCTR